MTYRHVDSFSKKRGVRYLISLKTVLDSNRREPKSTRRLLKRSKGVATWLYVQEPKIEFMKVFLPDKVQSYGTGMGASACDAWFPHVKYISA